MNNNEFSARARCWKNHRYPPYRPSDFDIASAEQNVENLKTMRKWIDAGIPADRCSLFARLDFNPALTAERLRQIIIEMHELEDLAEYGSDSEYWGKNIFESYACFVPEMCDGKIEKVARNLLIDLGNERYELEVLGREMRELIDNQAIKYVAA